MEGAGGLIKQPGPGFISRSSVRASRKMLHYGDHNGLWKGSPRRRVIVNHCLGRAAIFYGLDVHLH